MRGAVCLLVLCLAAESAIAQVGEPPKSAEQIKEIEDRVSNWRATCLEDWDAATHMSRQE